MLEPGAEVEAPLGFEAEVFAASKDGTADVYIWVGRGEGRALVDDNSYVRVERVRMLTVAYEDAETREDLLTVRLHDPATDPYVLPGTAPSLAALFPLDTAGGAEEAEQMLAERGYKLILAPRLPVPAREAIGAVQAAAEAARRHAR